MPFPIAIEDGSGRILRELYVAHDRYLFADGTDGFISSIAAWCRRCQDFVLVENLSMSGPDALEKYARKRFEENPLRFADSDEQRAIPQRQLDALLHPARQLKAALAARQSPPRCLECGETDYIEIPEEGSPWVLQAEIPFGRVRVRHLNCHVSMRRGRLFDTEGRPIEDSK